MIKVDNFHPVVSTDLLVVSPLYSQSCWLNPRLFRLVSQGKFMVNLFESEKYIVHHEL